jgi:xanthine dehydrogenase accessory factor
MQDIHALIATRRRDGRASVLVTVVATRGHAPTEPGIKMLAGREGLIAGTVGGGAIEKLALAEAAAVLERGAPLLKEYLLDDAPGGHAAPGAPEPTGMVCGGRVTLFFEPLGAGDRAVLFGAGHVNRALCRCLEPLGFDTLFVDYRPEQLADLPAPHRTAGDDYAHLPDLPDLDRAFVVVATHSHACDERVLEHLLRAGARPRYLGVVASRRKRVEIERNLRGRLGADVDLDWLRMPVGLHLGGNSPAAVALSIAAEMQACRHGIDGHRTMRDRAGGGPTPKELS